SLVIAAPKPGLLTRLRFKVPFLITLAMAWLILVAAVALFADVFRPYEITQMNLLHRLAPMGTPGHWLGTDELGRDVLSRLIQSIRVSLVLAFGATILSAVFGTTLGFLAAQFRGWVEHIVVAMARSEEHTSELQSRENLVCRLLLEKKKKNRFELAHK